jgi:hypothetical protein
MRWHYHQQVLDAAGNVLIPNAQKRRVEVGFAGRSSSASGASGSPQKLHPILVNFTAALLPLALFQ